MGHVPDRFALLPVPEEDTAIGRGLVIGEVSGEALNRDLSQGSAAGREKRATMSMRIFRTLVDANGFWRRSVDLSRGLTRSRRVSRISISESAGRRRCLVSVRASIPTPVEAR